MLRRSKTIVFDDEQDADGAPAGASRPTLRRNPDALRAASLRSVAPEPDFIVEDEAPQENPVRQRFDHLSAELERSPISKGSQESLQALREEFRRKHVGNDEPSPAVSRPSLSFGRLKPSRILLLLVALIAGGLAAWLAVGRAPEPIPQPAPVIVEPVAAPVAPTLEVLVARENIAPGTRLTADLLDWQKWPEETVRAEYVTSTASPSAMEEFAGRVSRSEILAGEPVRAERLSAPGPGFLSAILAPGTRAVSVAVDARSASGGFIVPDDRVDVVLTRTVGMEQVSRTILANVRVIAINERFGRPATGEETAAPEETKFDYALATLELDITQAELIINATSSGSLSLVLRPTADSVAEIDAAEQTINQSIRLTSPFWQGSPAPEKTAGADPLFPKMQTP